ncbi:hypothetical protein DICPUDRAFT_97591 [Dictyostelium purpureum]|uniref:DNA ligase 4 n=1 Tax=Dictyostelium purpureum TaxID=5786 RepID=F0ZI28_DICPU|nr:uncharacterized protein DICPUDRAFT_97591 [Dictyostelium purpureum]EGC36387.1 hypothetical protein DICPUDRAFT_97591 [Dictyostelium purpureum]|eukprot:XP_003287084.1 hypothetical protein DICPUDRAFT_97591 [Dictyostelium purpureum]
MDRLSLFLSEDEEENEETKNNTQNINDNSKNNLYNAFINNNYNNNNISDQQPIISTPQQQQLQQQQQQQKINSPIKNSKKDIDDNDIIKAFKDNKINVRNQNQNQINDYKYQKTVPFTTFCNLLDKIINDTKISNKKKYLSIFFSKYKEEPNNYFQLLRLLLPHMDRDRNTYGIKEKTLARLYVELLNISVESQDATRLLNWRKSTNADEIGGDFGSAIYLSLKNRCLEKGILSMGDINEALDRLNQVDDNKSKALILKKVLRSSTAQEQKWFVRLILKEMKMGLNEKTALKFFHPSAMDHLSITSNLRLVCSNLFYMSPEEQKKLKDEQKPVTSNATVLDIHNLKIETFNAIRPMLADRKPIDYLFSILDNNPYHVPSSNGLGPSTTSYIIEKKYDGERTQIHKDGNDIRFYSRNTNDTTFIYGSLLLPIVKECVLADKCILDGELIVWDTVTQRFEDFGKLKTLALNKDGISGSGDPLGANYGKQLCYIAFDILFVKDKSVMPLPLAQRTMLLKRCINVKDKQFEISEQTPVSTVQEVLGQLDAAIMNREEGLMLKDLNSFYVPAERKEKWIKIKPEYLDGMGDDFDLVIIGGYYGSGINRRGGTISHFMLGVAYCPDDVVDEESLQEKVVFYSFCKVGSGYTDEQLKILQKELDPHWSPFNTNKPPSCIQLAEPFKEKPDVWIDPRKFSKVVQIKAAQLNPTEKYKAGYTLRFPRVLKIRDDKSWQDCSTFSDILELYKNFQNNDFKFKTLLNNNSIKTTTQKKRKLEINGISEAGSGPGKLKVLSIFQDTDTSNIVPIQNIFQGLEFCVIKGNQQYTKSKLEIMIVELGGTKVQNPSKNNTHYVIGSKEVVKIQNLISSGFFDIVLFQWVVDCYNEQKLIPLGPKYMIFTTESTKKKFLLESDPFGDSYFNETNFSELKDCFNQVDKENCNHSNSTNINNNKQIIKGNKNQKLLNNEQFSIDKSIIELKYFSKNCWWTLFKPNVFYLDRYQVIGEPSTLIENNNLELSSLYIEFYGGTVSLQLNDTVTHVVIDQSDQSRIPFINNKINSIKKLNQIEIINPNWIKNLIDNIK